MKTLNIKIPTYEFKLGDDNFVTTKVPTELYKNKISRIWAQYDKHPEMRDYTQTDNNPLRLNYLKEEGIIQINMIKYVYESRSSSLILKESIISNLEKDPNRKRLIESFLKLKNENPYIGIFIKELNDNISELDWLPIPIRNLISVETSNDSIIRSFNIYNDNEEAYLVSFIHEKNEIYFEQSHLIGNSSIFYDDLKSFSSVKLLEIGEFLPKEKLYSITKAWDFFYVNRYQYYMGEHPYSTLLDPIVLDEQDKIRTFLIWLNRLQEYIFKLKEIIPGKTILLTNKHNEFNGEYVSYNTTYTPEIRKEIISKKEIYNLYTIANDWFIKENI